MIDDPRVIAIWLGDVILPVFITLIVAFAVYVVFKSQNFSLKAGSIELSALNKTEAEIRARLDHQAKSAGPSERQYALLKEYHAQGLAQSKISFWFSLIFASLGFLIIFYSIFFYLGLDNEIDPIQAERIGISPSIQKPVFALIAGTVVEAVAALFFVQSNKARQLMSQFFDKARMDRKLDESLVLSSEIKDREVASRLKAYLAVSFADAKPSDTIVASILGSNDVQQNPENEPKG